MRVLFDLDTGVIGDWPMASLVMGRGQTKFEARLLRAYGEWVPMAASSNLLGFDSPAALNKWISSGQCEGLVIGAAHISAASIAGHLQALADQAEAETKEWPM